MIVVVPVVTAVQRPFPVPMVATEVVLLVQIPELPYGNTLRPVKVPIQVEDGPKIGLGELPTNTLNVCVYPAPI